mmetsp:Transcript_85623/g.173800  ORF Transcript_85623/g.173800 Transcript_85623/m.173800 type:complete len:246 (+) Transcript_85623:683-1420(+)
MCRGSSCHVAIRPGSPKALLGWQADGLLQAAASATRPPSSALGLSSAATRAPAPAATAQRLPEGGAQLLAGPQGHGVQDCVRLRLVTPAPGRLEDAPEEVGGEDAARTLLLWRTTVGALAELERGHHLALQEAALDDAGVHGSTCASGGEALAIEDIEHHDSSSDVPRLYAARHQARPDHACRRHTVHISHLLRHEVVGEIQAARTREQLHKDGEGDATGSHIALPHLCEEPQAQLQVARLDATL